MRKGKRVDRGYATVFQDEGANYRDISEKMTASGFPMNHSSARNYLLRGMQKFAEKLVPEQLSNMSEKEHFEFIRSPHFQRAVADLLQQLDDG